MQTQTWFPVFTLMLGFVTKILFDWLQHRRKVEREREAREAARRDQILERRVIFQRQTLLELQDAITDVARTTAEMHFEDRKVYQSTARWQKQVYPDDLDSRATLAMRRSAMLTVRVRDDATRELVAKFKRFAASVTDCNTFEGSDDCFRRMAPAFDELQGRVGEVLRGLDDYEDANDNAASARKES